MSANQKPTHKQVLSLRDVRLASTRGHVILVDAGVPTTIPEALFVEAAKNGCVDYSPAMIEAFKSAVERAESLADGEEPKDSMDVINKLAKDAVKHVMLAAEDSPELLTAQGLPRVPVVRAAFETLCADAGVNGDVKITLDLVQDFYLQVQEEGDAVELDRSKEAGRPAPVPKGNLADEEVGGDVSEMLERVAEQEE
jgi:hypothetical protein